MEKARGTKNSSCHNKNSGGYIFTFSTFSPERLADWWQWRPDPAPQRKYYIPFVCERWEVQIHEKCIDNQWLSHQLLQGINLEWSPIIFITCFIFDQTLAQRELIHGSLKTIVSSWGNEGNSINYLKWLFHFTHFLFDHFLPTRFFLPSFCFKVNSIVKF